MFEENLLRGKTAVITGSGRGIGREIAIGYARAGAQVCISSRSENELDETVETIRAFGGTAWSSVCDVADLGSVETLFSFAGEKLGKIDILVVNAGVNPEKTLIEESNPENWKKTIDINLMGAYYCVRSVIPWMKKNGGGKIITIGSGKGHNGSKNGSAYACSKAGLWMLTTVLAEELEEYSIDVNELVPGPTLTQMNANFGNKVDSIFTSGKEWVKNTTDIVPLALFMAAQPHRGPSFQSYSLTRRKL